MIDMLTLESFLVENNISKEIWEKSNCNWEELKEIALRHEEQKSILSEAATTFANRIQKFNKVHSVRWRVKTSEHLIEKIIRKKAEKNEKYTNINKENYADIVTDLIGIRALHLFKEDCIDIYELLNKNFNKTEVPIAYVREGDPVDFLNELGFDVKLHPEGYRSIHFVFYSQPFKTKIVAEVQIRTIFEEAWSEINHTIIYPNFSNDELIKCFLNIFNRLAGSADAMGSFVKILATKLSEYQKSLSDEQCEKEVAFKRVSELVDELQELKSADSNKNAKLDNLKIELEKLKKRSKVDSVFNQLARDPYVTLGLEPLIINVPNYESLLDIKNFKIENPLGKIPSLYVSTKNNDEDKDK